MKTRNREVYHLSILGGDDGSVDLDETVLIRDETANATDTKMNIMS